MPLSFFVETAARRLLREGSYFIPADGFKCLCEREYGAEVKMKKAPPERGLLYRSFVL
jgi:hypothetical protein